MGKGSNQPLTEMLTRNIFWGYRWPVLRADNLTTFMCRLSRNLEASISWNPLNLSRPVQGLLYLYLSRFAQCHMLKCITLHERTKIQILTLYSPELSVDSHHNFVCFPCLPSLSTCPTRSNLIDSTALKVSGNLYKLQEYLSCRRNMLHVSTHSISLRYVLLIT